MAVTLKQIATLVGVSTPTVSHVLSGRGESYSEKTRAQVLAAARRMGYRPNGSARAIRNGRFGSVALLLSTEPHRSSLSEGVLDGIYEGLNKQDLHLMVARLPDAELTREGHIPKILREWMVDGLLINYFADIPQRMVELIPANRVPSVWMNSKQPADCVYPDDFDAGRRAAQQFLELGHRRIAFIDYTTSVHYSSQDRALGYEQAMREAGLPPQVIRPAAPVPRDERINFSQTWLKRRSRPTAVITYAPTTAWPIIEAARTLGLSVPRHLSITTFSDHPVNDTGLAIGTFVLPHRDLSIRAVEMLLSKIGAPESDLKSQAVPLAFAAGQTHATCA